MGKACVTLHDFSPIYRRRGQSWTIIGPLYSCAVVPWSSGVTHVAHHLTKTQHDFVAVWSLNHKAPFHIWKTCITLPFPCTDRVCASGNRKQIVYSVVGCLVAKCCKWLLSLFILCLCYRYQGRCRGNRYNFFFPDNRTKMMRQGNVTALHRILPHNAIIIKTLSTVLFHHCMFNVFWHLFKYRQYNTNFINAQTQILHTITMTLTAYIHMQSFRWAIL